MSYDYFLLHRAHQIQNLRANAEGNRLEVPDRHNWGGFPRELVKLFKSIEQICKMPIGDDAAESEGGFFSRLRLPGLGTRRQDSESDTAENGMLTDSQRVLLTEFEKELVRLRFSKEPSSVDVSGRFVRAILNDHEFFYGLKPLPHADSFGYELLFPTWLNLYTAMNVAARDGQPRFAHSHQATVFEFLENCECPTGPAATDLVGAVTYLINRCEAGRAHDLVQRLIDLCCDAQGKCTARCVEWLPSAMEFVHDAPEVQRRLCDSLIVQSSVFSSGQQKGFNVAEKKVQRRSLPKIVAEEAKRLAADVDRDAFFRLVGHVRAIMEDAGGFSTAFAALLSEYPRQLEELLQMVGAQGEDASAGSQRSQEVVARVAKQETADGRINTNYVRPFAVGLAPRLDGFADSTKLFFNVEFIQKEKNRRTLLDSCQDPTKRRSLAGRLLKLAVKTTDKARFFDLLAVSSALDPQHDADDLERMHLSIVVLQSAHADRSIGSNELEDLFKDLRENLPESLSYLKRPLSAAAGKSERLVKLYLALNEECELYKHTGRVSNFGVTRASFSHLDRLTAEGHEEDSSP